MDILGIGRVSMVQGKNVYRSGKSVYCTGEECPWFRERVSIVQARMSIVQGKKDRILIIINLSVHNPDNSLPCLYMDPDKSYLACT